MFNNMKWMEQRCDENRLKVQRSEVRWSIVFWGEMERQEIYWGYGKWEGSEM